MRAIEARRQSEASEYSVSAAEAGRVRCRLTPPLLRLLTSGCVSDAVSGPNTGRSRRGRSSIYTARAAAAAARPRAHGVTIYYNDIFATDAATCTAAAQPPTTLSTAAGTAIAAAATAADAAAHDCCSDDRRPRWRLVIRNAIVRPPASTVLLSVGQNDFVCVFISGFFRTRYNNSCFIIFSHYIYYIPTGTLHF